MKVRVVIGWKDLNVWMKVAASFSAALRVRDEMETLGYRVVVVEEEVVE